MAEAALAFTAAAGADWSGRDLAGVQARFCDLAGADLGGATAAGSFWQHCSLRGVRLREADLTDATLVDCDLSGADLRAARLAGARLLRCSLESARLGDCELDDATMVGCSLADAELHGVRNATTARDLVVEVLRRRAGDDLELLRWVGLVALRRDWCYEEFAQALDGDPALRAMALECFSELPHSGLAEALASPRQGALESASGAPRGR